MANLFGLAGISASDYQFINTIGQSLVYDATRAYLERVNADMQAALSVFVDTTTTDFKSRYQLPGAGRLQRRGEQARAAAVRASGSWDVAFPLEDFGASVAKSDVDMAYMTAAEYQRHVDTVINQDRATVRFEILKGMLNNTQRSFVDARRGTLSIEPLANGDSVVYPPVLGSESETTDDHYLESGYAASGISDANNPLVTINDELSEHFETMTGNEAIAVFINNAQTAKIKALTDFDEVPDRFLQVGDNANVPVNLPNVPGKIIGRGSGCWVVEWRWIPANYMVGIHLEHPAPLRMRVDPAETGLPQGLQLVAVDEDYPISRSEWRHRFGIGAANRLNGVVMELGTGGTYSIPSGYS